MFSERDVHFAKWEAISQRNSPISRWEYSVLGIGLSVNPISCLPYLYVFRLFLERGISLPAAQMVVIAMEKILRRGVGNLTRL